MEISAALWALWLEKDIAFCLFFYQIWQIYHCPMIIAMASTITMVIIRAVDVLMFLMH